MFHRVLASCALVLVACSSSPAAQRATRVFPVGTPKGARTEATIGPAGGELRTEDGAVAITVPAGALASETTLSIQEVTSPFAQRVFRFGPEGQTFATPVEISFALDGDGLGRARVGFQDAEGRFVMTPDTTVANGRASTKSTHFSDWTYVYEAILEAKPTSVRVGESATLRVLRCLYREVGTGGTDLEAAIAPCETFDDAPVIFDHPSVNGVEGGNASVGTVSGSDGSYTYHAPASVPSQNPVAVSVVVDYTTEQHLVVANVTVVPDAAYTGNAHQDQGAIQVDAQVSWREETDYDGVVHLVPSGNVTYAMSGCTFSPSGATIAAGDGYLEIDRTVSPPRYYGNGTTSWTATMTCADQPPTEWTVIANWLLATEPTAVSADGALAGTSSFWTWSFEAAR